jgi:hypothetical protein
MSARTYIAFFLSLICSAVLTGCGGSGPAGATPINGPFSNSSLNGTYAITFTGVNQAGFLAVAASFQANGSGTITSGVADVNSGTGIFTNQSVTGSYTVHNNGQGTATLTTAAGTFDIDFVLISSTHALVIRFDNNSTASGSMDLQSSGAFSLSSLAGTYAFNVSGVDSGGHSDGSVGAVTVDSSGNLTSGVEDNNDDGTVSTNVALVPTSGAVSSPSAGNGRGTLTITGTSTLHFIYYIVNSNQVNLIEADLSPVLAGNAFRQTATAISGSFVFTIGGVSTGGAFVAGGIINTDGAGNVLSTSIEDTNNGGVISQNVPLSGTYSVAANGRGTVTLNSGTINLAAYPSTAGIQLLEIDSTTVANGTALPQTGTFSSGSFQGTYGMNFTGVISGGTEIDSNAQFSADGTGKLSGALDANNGGSLSSNLALTGTFTVSSNGRGTLTLNSNLGSQSIVFFMASNTRVLFIDEDANLVAVGEMQHQ